MQHQNLATIRQPGVQVLAETRNEQLDVDIGVVRRARPSRDEPANAPYAKNMGNGDSVQFAHDVADIQVILLEQGRPLFVEALVLDPRFDDRRHGIPAIDIFLLHSQPQFPSGIPRRLPTSRLGQTRHPGPVSSMSVAGADPYKF